MCFVWWLQTSTFWPMDAFCLVTLHGDISWKVAPAHSRPVRRDVAEAMFHTAGWQVLRLGGPGLKQENGLLGPPRKSGSMFAVEIGGRMFANVLKDGGRGLTVSPLIFYLRMFVNVHPHQAAGFAGLASKCSVPLSRWSAVMCQRMRVPLNKPAQFLWCFQIWCSSVGIEPKGRFLQK